MLGFPQVTPHSQTFQTVFSRLLYPQIELSNKCGQFGWKINGVSLKPLNIRMK